jgi:hypothetical protein
MGPSGNGYVFGAQSTFEGEGAKKKVESVSAKGARGRGDENEASTIIQFGTKRSVKDTQLIYGLCNLQLIWAPVHSSTGVR